MDAAKGAAVEARNEWLIRLQSISLTEQYTKGTSCEVWIGNSKNVCLLLPFEWVILVQ
jgi:hypothetical protein